MFKENNNDLMEKIVSLCKRRGFVFPGSEIYGGLAGTYDYGPYGSELAHNIKELWWKHFVKERDDIFGLTSATLMPEAVWKASGHLENFTDPLGDEKFNTMFKLKAGALKDETVTVYLRPELAQGMFINFKNVLDTMHPKLPFGLAQIGRAYRNEIAPRDFLFREREFDLMEFEYFVREKDWEKYFEMWRESMWDWIERVGIDKNIVHELEVTPKNRAHYSKRTIDFEFNYPFGRKELYGLAHRTDFDLQAHKLDYYDEETKESFVPHVIEPTFGHGRTMLAVLLSSYKEDGERVYLALKPEIAPVKIAVFPLLRNKSDLVNKAREIYKNLKKEFGAVEFDDRGNIGKRYYSQDEIGTPYCVTIDFDTLGENPELKDTVTVRDRDTGNQERIKIADLLEFFKTKAQS